MREKDNIIRTLVRFPNIPFNIIFIFIILLIAKGNTPIKQFLIESLDSKRNTAILEIYDKYAELYYPQKARYIIAITFYITIILWIF